MTKGCSKLKTISALMSELDKDFKDKIDQIIDSNGCGYTLLSLLRVVPATNVNIPKPLVDVFLKCYTKIPSETSDPAYKKEAYCFLVCGKNMNVTLEDVLYLTHLPITGTPMVNETNRDPTAFGRVFPTAKIVKKHLSLVELKKVCLDCEKTDDDRIRALLLLVVSCLVVPNGDGQNCNTSFIPFIEHLDKVDSYAWGAAMLPYLYRGLRKKETKSGMDGFVWLVIGFFFYHIEELIHTFEIKMDGMETPPKPLLKNLIKALAKVGASHRSKLLEQKLSGVRKFLPGSGEDMPDITWHPYTLNMLPDHLHDQTPYCTAVVPLFCYNYVENHLPHLVARQFQVLDGIELDHDYDLGKIVFKANSGPTPINFKKHYEKEVKQWLDIDNRLAQSYNVALSNACTSLDAHDNIDAGESDGQDPPTPTESNTPNGQQDTNEGETESVGQDPSPPTESNTPNGHQDTNEGEGGGDNIVNETNPQTPPPRRRRRPGFPTPPKKLEEGKRKTRGIPVERYHGERWKMAKKKPKKVRK